MRCGKAYIFFSDTEANRPEVLLVPSRWIETKKPRYAGLRNMDNCEPLRWRESPQGGPEAEIDKLSRVIDEWTSGRVDEWASGRVDKAED